MSSRQKLLLIGLGLFLLNLLAGLTFINEGLFHHDAVMLARAVEDLYNTGHLQPATRGRFGAVIINSIVYLPFSLFGQNSDFAIRFSSVLFHAFSIVVMFLLARELLRSALQAVIAAMLLSFTPFYFSPNTYGKEHGLSIFFILSSFYFLLRGMNKGLGAKVALSSFLLACAVSIRESMLVVVPLYFLLYLRPRIQRFSFKLLFSCILPFSVCFMAMYKFYLKAELYREFVKWDMGSAIFVGFFSPVFANVLRDIFLAVPWLLFLFSLLGMYTIFRRKDIFLAIFLLLWFSTIIYFGNLSTYAPRYLDLVIIPVYLTASYPLADLLSRNKPVGVALCLYFLVSMWICMYPMLSFRHNYNGEKQFALFVEANTEPNALIITMDDAPFIEYYAHRKALGHPPDTISGRQEITEFLRKVSAYLARKIPVYLTGSGLTYDRRKIFQSMLVTNYDISVVGSRLSEDYHRPELTFRKYDQLLFKLALKQFNGQR